MDGGSPRCNPFGDFFFSSELFSTGYGVNVAVAFRYRRLGCSQRENARNGCGIVGCRHRLFSQIRSEHDTASVRSRPARTRQSNGKQNNHKRTTNSLPWHRACLLQVFYLIAKKLSTLCPIVRLSPVPTPTTDFACSAARSRELGKKDVELLLGSRKRRCAALVVYPSLA